MLENLGSQISNIILKIVIAYIAITYCIIKIAKNRLKNEKLTLTETSKNVKELATLEDWNEEDGDCIWWRFPIEEPPYIGSPLDVNFPEYVTHFTRIIMPEAPIE